VKNPFSSAKPKTVAATADAEAKARAADIKDYGLDLTWWRTSWNMDVSVKAMAALCLSIGYSLIMTILVAFLVFRPAPVEIIPLTPSGLAIPVEPLNVATFKDAQVLSFARNAILETYSFNFSNVKHHLRRVSRDFSTKAWEQFFSSLTKNGVVQSTIDDRRTVTVEPVGAPQIIKQRLLPDGRYGWLVRMPILVDYSASSTDNQEPAYYNVNVVVVRSNKVTHPSGLKIIQFVPVRSTAAESNGN
jgi:hypothetical protein